MAKTTVTDSLQLVTTSTVDHVYERLKEMAVRFELLPDTRINEVELAAKLGVSRTPLREALNRLTSDGFLRYVPGKGFHGKPLDVKEICDLYEVRLLLEIGAAEAAVDRATDEQIEALKAYVDGSAEIPQEDRSIDELIDLSEGFHERFCALSGNMSLLKMLRRINERIRFVRWVNMENGTRGFDEQNHRDIIRMLEDRDKDALRGILQKHIGLRFDQIAKAVRDGYGYIYTSKRKRD